MSYVCSSPVSKMTLRWRVAAGLASTATISSYTFEVAPGEERAAVDDHVDLVGAGLDGVAGVGELDVEGGAAAGERGGDGGDVDAGAAERLPSRWRPCRGRRRRPRSSGQVGSVGSGRMALDASARTLPGVSAPSSVVRSTIRIARSMANALAVVLIERVPRVAARASAPTWSTPGRPCRKRRKDDSDAVMSSKTPALVVEAEVVVTAPA